MQIVAVVLNRGSGFFSILIEQTKVFDKIISNFHVQQKKQIKDFRAY
jgi:hypothetical protein